ncbi:hypothetical protein C8R42DRAFT_680723 [Lentinula raphanica]|nr:hypothetical protein C8R42DRAFT_680723 [Lentinula raphanica]
MATTAYTIYSHYDPADREKLERETLQLQEHDGDGAWEAEGVKAFKRKQAPPPRFVPATSTSSLNIDDWSTPGAGPSTTSSASSSTNEVSEWYRSMVSFADIKQLDRIAPMPSSRSTSSQTTTTTTVTHKKPTKNDWFIQKALASDTPAQTRQTSSHSLADILARNPLPAPNEERFKPPVFLAIGPSNRGFAMLQNKGWNEGEALGQDVVRRRRLQRNDPSPWIKEEVVETSVGDGEIREIKKTLLIDLTISDSESDLEPEPDLEEGEPEDVDTPTANQQSLRLDGRKALLTPLPTVLKSDRLGIGLKAKTVGPYKESVKRVTHNAAALAAHYQRAEDARMRREKWGRGRRGFARREKEERIRRQNMLSYMNS